LKILVRPLISPGRFFFPAPADLRWEYTTPFRSVLLLYGGRIRKFTERNGALVEEQGLQLDAMQVVLGEISGWLDGRFTDNAAFTTEFKDEKIVVLTPKSEGMRSFIRRIELKIADQAGLLDSVTIVEGPGSSTRLTFSHGVLNQAVAESLFTTP
ncbi:MAG: outer membrane lipoprotein carrier protein LolA, partial [Desulfobulbaceae bacterium]|nr:outer membrane lipoprotein carrier protein LolA [Desulfobulbaceae bacterium]